MATLQELSNEQLADFRGDLNTKIETLYKKKKGVKGKASVEKITGQIEDLEARRNVVEQEIKRRGEEALKRGELRHEDNPDWETRPIPPVHVGVCDAWRAFVAEGAGASGPTYVGNFDSQTGSFTIKTDIPQGAGVIGPVLTVAQAVKELTDTLKPLAELATKLNKIGETPATLVRYLKQVELVTKNLEEADAARKKAEAKEKLGG